MGFLARKKLKIDSSTRSAKNQAAVHFDVVGEDLIVLIPDAEYEHGTKKDNSSGEPAYDTNTVETYEDNPDDPALPQSALLMSMSQPDALGEDNLEGYDLSDITLTSGDCEKARLKLGIESSIDLTQEYYTDLTQVPTGEDIVYGGNVGDPEPGTDMGGPQVSGPGGPKIGGMSAFWVNKVVEATTKIVDKNNNVIAAEIVDGTKATWENVDANWVASVVGQIDNSFRQVDTNFIVTEKMNDFVLVDVLGVPPKDDIVVDFKFEIGYGPQTGYQTSAYGSYDSDKLDVVAQLSIVDTPIPAAPIQMQSVF